ncbi:MAG: ATP-binding protein [Acidimicrobiales bacterium]
MKLPRPRRSLRFEITLGSTVVVAAALIVGSFYLVGSLRSELVSQLDASLAGQVSDRLSLIDSGSDPSTLLNAGLHDTIGWIGRPDGSTLSSSGHRLAEIPDLAPGQVETVEVALLEDGGRDEHEIENETVRMASGASLDGSILVFVGQELSHVESTVSTAETALVIGVPILTLLVAVAVWAAVGRALRPVERIRLQAQAVSGRELDIRVPTSGSGDEIDRLAHTMNDMLDRLSEHDLAQRRFASDASHELKSPTANIRVLAETASATDWDVTRARIAAEADRLGSLVDDLLFLNISGERTSAVDQVDLDDILFDEAQTLAAHSSVDVSIGAVTPQRVAGVAGELRRAVRNLADNAARHAESAVVFDLAERGDRVVLAVTDDGSGVPLEDRERIFERFTRLDESRQRQSGGTGLGLAIVADIASRHGGSIRVVDPGNRFELTLPKAAGGSGAQSRPGT